MDWTPEHLRNGWIYYALGATAQLQWVKIGFTANLRQRMNSLRREAPGRQIPTVLAVEAGTFADEIERHARWTAYRVRGEWFRYEGDLRRHIASLPDLVEVALRPSLAVCKPQLATTDRVSDDQCQEQVERIHAADAQIALIEAEISEALAIRDADVRGLIAEHGPAGARDLTGYSASTIRLIRGRPTGEGIS